MWQSICNSQGNGQLCFGDKVIVYVRVREREKQEKKNWWEHQAISQMPCFPETSPSSNCPKQSWPSMKVPPSKLKERGKHRCRMRSAADWVLQPSLTPAIHPFYAGVSWTHTVQSLSECIPTQDCPQDAERQELSNHSWIEYLHCSRMGNLRAFQWYSQCLSSCELPGLITSVWIWLPIPFPSWQELMAPTAVTTRNKWFLH